MGEKGIRERYCEKGKEKLNRGKKKGQGKEKGQKRNLGNLIEH